MPAEHLPCRLAALACVAALAACLPALTNAWHEERIIAAMQADAPSQRGDMLDRYADTLPARLSSRAQAALAQMALRGAAQAADAPLRRLYLARAGELIGHLQATRPGWAPGLLLAAEWSVAQTPVGAPWPAGALRAYGASYRAAPFLWPEAGWRIAFGAQAWPLLDRATRTHLLDEAVWATRVDGDQRPVIEALLGDSPAGVAFQLRLAGMPPA